VFVVPQYQNCEFKNINDQLDIEMTEQVTIRNAMPTDFDAVIKLDLVGDPQEKPAYWRGIFDRYVTSGRAGSIFLVAETNGEVIGFIVGEVRAWEFGSPPCGWVFALSVSLKTREMGVGQLMLEEMCKRLKKAGVTTVRTMVDRENKLTLSFFRSQGMRTGRYIELEKLINDI
jgi:ribosomal protein S18 acetylase RimI-like enzyme